MITIKKEGVILEKTAHAFENEAVSNPGILQDGNTVHIFYRAVRKGNYSTIGYCQLENHFSALSKSKSYSLQISKKLCTHLFGKC